MEEEEGRRKIIIIMPKYIKINTCNNKMSHDDLVAELDKYESRRDVVNLFEVHFCSTVKMENSPYHFTLHIGKLGGITSTIHCTVKRSQHWPFRFPSAMGWCKTVIKSNKRSM